MRHHDGDCDIDIGGPCSCGAFEREQKQEWQEKERKRLMRHCDNCGTDDRDERYYVQDDGEHFCSACLIAELRAMVEIRDKANAELTAKLETSEKRIGELAKALSLANCMITCGEKHSEVSVATIQQALKGGE